MSDKLKEKLKTLPDAPGVYIMKNAIGEIIYIGKAVSLKNRVRQYFQSSRNHAPKVIAMVSNIDDFEYILTETETEALTLESNLIKQHKPRYNILLKDDKQFPFVRIDLKAPFPRVEVVRRVKRDGAKYIGPYLSSHALHESLDAVRDTFPIRSCKKDIAKAIARRERPCLNHHIGKCIAPCSGNVGSQEYGEIVEDVIAFLSGRTEPVIARLHQQMMQASANLEFEKAADLRDKISAVKGIGEKQKAIAAGLDERDVFALVADGPEYVVYALFFRAGKLCGTSRFEMRSGGEASGLIMESFLQQYYADVGYVPKEVVIRDKVEPVAELEQWLSALRGNKVTLTCPQKGGKKKLTDMAYRNGTDYMQRMSEQKRRDWERHEGALAALSVVVGLPSLPERIEAFDISHIQGTNSVGGMVVFKNGRPEPKEYRRFKIKTVQGPDDYASLQEIITRRLKRSQGDTATAGFTELPDLMLIDGGKGQLNAALKAMDAAGVTVPALGLAERNEELFLPGSGGPIVIEKGNPALYLIQCVRDEAHRFAITYHRSLRSKSALMSQLDGIAGIGEKRKRALFDEFVTLDGIKAADVARLASVKSMDKISAQAVYDFFRQDVN